MKLRKQAVLAFLLSGLIAGVTYAGIDVTTPGKVSEGLNSFADALTTAVPDAATQQNIWADAYIGRLLPSVVPHLGGGLNFGVTHIDTSGLADAADALDISDVPDSFYLPTITADLRLGGVIFPFDIGINVMKTNTMEFNSMGADLGLDFFTIGADLRWALYQGNILMPKISLGGGYIYTKGSFTASSSEADLKVNYTTQTAYLQVQVSKKIVLFTPFVGLRAIISDSDNDWSWKTNGSIATQLSSVGMVTSDKGTISSNWDFADLQPQLYAGLGFNFLFLQLTGSVTADLRNIADNGLWSGALSLRIVL
jgi:hypothetical protein